MSLALCIFNIKKTPKCNEINNVMFCYMYNDGTNKLVASLLNVTLFDVFKFQNDS